MGDGRAPLIGSDARTPAPGTHPCTMTGTETGRQTAGGRFFLWKGVRPLPDFPKMRTGPSV